ncbi:MAG: hypothetical protein E2O38_15200 [Proteobacteria bacterium]|nr:MAG: hypothetical protein E2O38_15200 [Pseudomonadota bacterium]
MKLVIRAGLILLLMSMPFTQAWADKYQDAIKIFKDAGRSSTFFGNSYGYTVFPTIGKGGIVVGAAHGKGRVYAVGKHVGDASMTQLTLGFQLGAQVYSQIIFFQDKRAFDEFTHGNFEFGVQAEAVAITAGASASVSTTGNSATASGGMNNAITRGGYYRGLAVFTVAKGGLMYEASIGGQKFKYTAK